MKAVARHRTPALPESPARLRQGRGPLVSSTQRGGVAIYASKGRQNFETFASVYQPASTAGDDQLFSKLRTLLA
jgi:hypothetical protein